MNTLELLKKLIDRIKKFSWVIVLMGLLFAGFFYYLAKQNVTVYIGRSTIFPLNATNENPLSGNNAISSILGLADAPKSFTADASINIVELANSRRTTEAVAMSKMPQFGNKTIAEFTLKLSWLDSCQSDLPL